ncbi:MAG: flagellar basal body-associated FliL family protein [Deltaproteobacteria bacterium]|nr:flagellar basal body-associated FliL family protein [Deltaproteobacteria bacterium]
MGYREKIDSKRNKRQKISRLTTLALIAVMLGSCLFFACGKDKEGASGSKSKNKVEENKIIVPLESFIVNLLGKSRLGNRYLKVIMQLEISSEKDKDLIDKHKPQLRDTILLFLSNQTFDDVKTVEGKLELKQSLLSRINNILGQAIVKQVYFTEFVVQ